MNELLLFIAVFREFLKKSLKILYFGIFFKNTRVSAPNMRIACVASIAFLCASGADKYNEFILMEKGKEIFGIGRCY